MISQIKQESDQSETLNLVLAPALLRRVKDRAIMAGMTPEQVAIELIKSALGERKDSQRKEPTRRQQQLILLRDAIRKKRDTR